LTFVLFDLLSVFYWPLYCLSFFDLRFLITSLIFRGRNRLVVGFTTTYAISAYHHYSCEVEFRSWRDVLDTTVCDKVCQWFAADRWYYPGTPVSFTNKTHRHDTADILLKVALNTIASLSSNISLSYVRDLLSPCFIRVQSQVHD